MPLPPRPPLHWLAVTVDPLESFSDSYSYYVHMWSLCHLGNTATPHLLRAFFPVIFFLIEEASMCWHAVLSRIVYPPLTRLVSTPTAVRLVTFT